MLELFPDTHSVDEEVQQFARNAHKLAVAPVTLLLPVVRKLAEAMGTEPDVAMVKSILKGLIQDMHRCNVF